MHEWRNGIKINVTTRSDFKKFKSFVNYWITHFGLCGWRINFRHAFDADSLAYITYNILNRIVDVTLSKMWSENKVTESALNKVAFHEVCEILLVRLRYLAEERYITEDNVEEEIHNVIRTLENVVWEYEEG